MKNSNVAIDQATNDILNEFCTRTKITKKGFIEAALKYFNDYSINPNKHEKPSLEIEKMHKRIEDIFKFSKAQERDVLKPFLIQIAENNIKYKEEITSLKNGLNAFINSQAKQEKEKIEELKKMHQEQINLLQDQNKKFIQIILTLGENLESKNRGIFDSFKNSLK